MPPTAHSPGSKSHWTTRLGQASAHPAAFAVVLIYALVWISFERRTFDFNAVATLVVWAMTLLFNAPAVATRLPFTPSSTSSCGPMRTRGQNWHGSTNKSRKSLLAIAMTRSGT
jgi:hypothetical protein